MPTTPVNAWDERLLAATETTFGVTPTPASTGAYAALALEVISAAMGPVEVGQVRPKRDRNLGRGMQSGFVEGRVEPMAFSVSLSPKSRAAVDASPLELALYKAAGLKVTTNASTSVVLSMVPTPIESADFASCSLSRFLGSGAAAFEREVLRGCLVTGLRLEGGDKEVLATFTGKGVGKRTSGALDSITLASGGTTTLTHTAEESYRLSKGYYLCESEIIEVVNDSDVGYGSTSTTIARGVLGSSAVAHTAKPLYVYVPAPTFTGAPIAEPNATCSIGGVTMRLLSWSMDLTTGLDMLPGETGSKYVQGAKAVRYDVKYSVRAVLDGNGVSNLGKAQQRAWAGALPVSLSQGAVAGGVVTLASSYCEIEPFAVPDTETDVAIVDIGLRVRDNAAGNNAITITLT